MLPQIETLQTEWEKKAESLRFNLYHDAILDGLAKVKKYYVKFDNILAILLSLRKSICFPLIFTYR